jgi:hypothetical protein
MKLFSAFKAIFAVLILMSFPTFAVYADGYTVDVKYIADGVDFDIYAVADITDEENYNIKENFAIYPISLEDENAARTLLYYAKRDNTAIYKTEKTNAENRAVFEGVERGMYLLYGKIITLNNRKYTALPVLFTVTDSDLVIDEKFSSVPVGGSSGGGENDKTEKDTTEISVLKVWKNTENKTTVTAQLLCDGEVYDEAELDEDANWRYTWKNLPKLNEWTVVEKEVPDGFEVSIETNGDVFVITNTGTESEETTEITTENGYEETTSQTETQSEETTWSDTDKYLVNNPPKDDEEDENDGDDGSEYTENGKQKYKVPKQGEGLPQTGQTWWPVPILVFFGVLFVIIGEGENRCEEN